MDGGDKTTGPEQNEAEWQYKSSADYDGSLAPSDGPNVSLSQDIDKDAVEWSASEFVAHEKNFGWYAMLVLITAVVAVGLYFMTRDTLTAIVVVFMAAIFGVAGSHKPRVITYRVNSSGIIIGRNFHSYREYKSFAMSEDGPFASVVLIPMKRFGFPLSAYLAPDSQQRALDVISSHLPMERGKLDTVDQLMRQLRF